MANQIYRAGLTPLWGLNQTVSDKSQAVGLLVTSANITHNTKTYEQIDAVGRVVGALSYDDTLGMSIQGNVIYDAAGTGMDFFISNFTPGKAVEDEDAICLLNAVRIMELNETAPAGTGGTYFVNGVNADQTNEGAVSVSLDVTYYGFDPEPTTQLAPGGGDDQGGDDQGGDDQGGDDQGGGEP